MFCLTKETLRLFDNSIDSFIPEWWAEEMLAILYEEMIIGRLINTDFSAGFQNAGDVINISRPRDFIAQTKTNADEVTIQDAISDNVAIPLDQHIHTSFMIKDGEMSKALPDLIKTFMRPAAQSLARYTDKVLLGQYAQFFRNSAGKLGSLSSSNAVQYILATRQVMNDNYADSAGRFMIHNSSTETKLLNNEVFHSAEKVGDAGTALREASLGRKLGFEHYMCQNMAHILSGVATSIGEINNASGHAVGDTVLTVDGMSANECLVGHWISIEGEALPHLVTAIDSTTATSITITPALKSAVADNADITIITSGTVNNSPSGYAAGYHKEITIAGFSSVGPRVGQALTFGTDTSNIYVVREVNGVVGISLDKPLGAAIAHGARVNLAPTGDYSFAFLRNAFTWAVRPLWLPPTGTGVRAAVANHMGLPLRVCATYDGKKQGLLVTADFLAGVKVLDSNQGAIMCA